MPVRISDVAFVNIGPGTRRGGLDKEGVEAVGGVVIARYGSNPLEVINNIKDKIKEMAPGLPQKTLPDGTVSKITVVPFYDRTGLIKETIGTLETSLSHEILICIIVIIVLVLNLRASVVIASMLPIGVMVDVGVVFVESIIRYMEMPENRGIRKGKAMVNLIYKAVSEVSGTIATAMITTIVSFLPVFAMEAQEGKMFSPLAYTKTYALASAFVLGLILLPTLSYILFSVRIDSKRIRKVLNYILIAAGVLLSVLYSNIPALGLTAVGLNNLLAHRWKKPGISNYINIGIALVVATYFLAEEWLPMGPQKGIIVNLLFVTGCIAIILALLWLLVIYYERILRWCLNNRWKFMLLPIATILCGILIWKRIGQEFMPSLNEGSFLLMPTSMPHTGIEQNLNYIEALDKRLAAIPEVETAIGKWGRVNSALDPAPAQMFENTINYRPEYILNEDGKRERFKVNRKGEYLLRNGGTYNPADGFRLIPADSLIPDRKGDYFRQWRPEIKNTDDIWQQIVNVTHLPGLTSAPKLQPIEARLVMLSTGMRAPMGLKIYGPDLETIEQSGKAIEQALKDVPSVIPSSVFYDRAVGAPYLEIKLNRDNMARYGVNVEDLQEILSAAVGGMILTKTIEGCERFPVRLRYARELRDNPEALSMLLVPTATGAQIPLKELADIESVLGRPTPSVAPPVASPVPQTPANNSMGGMENMGTSPSTASATPGGNTTMSGTGGSMAGGTMGSGSSGSMSDVLRIQIEMVELENNLEALRSNRKAAEARFNSLLNRDQDLPVQTSDSLAQKLFSIEDNAVLDSIILSNPMLSMLEAEANAYKAKAEMDKKMSLPMFGIGLQYSIMAKNSEEMARMSGMSNMNGMDMVMPMIKISIPIFRRNITPSSGRAGITVRQAN